MANIVNTSLDLIRRHKARRPRLHSRWGDVAITPPVEGAWSQFDNPYLQEEKGYGPGFVPNIDITNKEILLLDSASDSSDDELYFQGKAKNVKEKHNPAEKADSKAVSKAKRLTRILLPSSVSTPVERKMADKAKDTDFQYRPVQPDYAQEVAEKADKRTRPHFRYVPASRHYLADLKREDVRQSGEVVPSRRLESDDDADDEIESKERQYNNRRPPRVRSHSCDPKVGNRSATGTTTLRTSQFRPGTTLETINSPTMAPSLSDMMASSSLSQRSTLTPSASSASGLREQESSCRMYAVRPGMKSQVVNVQRSSFDGKALRRRTMTLEMVRDKDDLWY